MILNISGRTDIIAFYSKWLRNRFEEGFVDVRNPFNPKLVSRIYFEDVEAIMFCTKNPIPILPYLKEISKPIVFHVTLTPYKKDIEPNVPDKKKIIEAIKKISKIVGKDYLFIRYDPIFISSKYTLQYHQKAFKKLCQSLDGYVKRIIISFLDDYKNVRKNQNILNAKIMQKEDYQEIGLSFSQIAKQHHMTVQTCFEEENLVEYGFVKGECFSKEMAYQLTKKEYKKWTARKERKCECVELVDIGAYNSCTHLCKYCYANYDEKKVFNNQKMHDPTSSLLLGTLNSDDKIVRRKNKKG